MLTGAAQSGVMSGTLRCRMGKLVVAAFTAATVCGLAWHGTALAEPNGPSMGVQAVASEVSAQQRTVRRARSRITVYPRSIPYEQSIGRSGNRFDVFPRPYRYEWPGPNAQRDCISWLAPEYRPSGTVIVPRLRCRWIPG